MAECTRTPGGIEIPPSALRWSFSRSGGPGGQHVNTSDTKVELVCDVGLLEADPSTIQTLKTVLGDSVRIVESTTRSQHTNRVVAMDRLVARLDAAARPRKRRRPTSPSRSSVEARLKDKRELSMRKNARQWNPDE